MGFWRVNLKERNRLEDLVVDEVTKINLNLLAPELFFF